MGCKSPFRVCPQLDLVIKCRVQGFGRLSFPRCRFKKNLHKPYIISRYQEYFSPTIFQRFSWITRRYEPSLFIKHLPLFGRCYMRKILLMRGASEYIASLSINCVQHLWWLKLCCQTCLQHFWYRVGWISALYRITLTTLSTISIFIK